LLAFQVPQFALGRLRFGTALFGQIILSDLTARQARRRNLNKDVTERYLLVWGPCEKDDKNLASMKDASGMLRLKKMCEADTRTQILFFFY
jgi:hypothetical protein